MDATTLQFYQDQATPLAARYTGVESVAARYFADTFSRGGRVLDVGCGAGRDLFALLRAGYEAEGVDACAAMLREAATWYPELNGRLHLDTLPNLAGIPDVAFDGVLCSAVLMHVPAGELLDTVLNLRRVLRPGGGLLLSTPLLGPVVDPVTRREASGRLFNGVTPEQYQFLLESAGFHRRHRWDAPDSMGRVDRSWASQAFVRSSFRPTLYPPGDAALARPPCRR